MTPERADMIRATWLRYQDHIKRELSPVGQDQIWIPPLVPMTYAGPPSGPPEMIQQIMFRLEPGSYSSNSAHRITCEGLVLARGVKAA